MAFQRFLCLSLILIFTIICSSDAYRFIVGGKDGWVLNPSENYTHWSERSRFSVNDTIYFKYKNGSDSVLVVSRDDYDKCKTETPISEMDGGDSEFKFDRSGPFYFISGKRGNCEKGQKLAIVVLAVRNGPPNPPPSPANSPVPTPANSPVPVPANTPVPAPAYSPVPAPANSPVPAPANSPVPTPENSPTSGAPGPVMPPVISSPPSPQPPNSPIPSSLPPPGAIAPTSGRTPAGGANSTAPAGSSANTFNPSFVLVSSVIIFSSVVFHGS